MNYTNKEIEIEIEIAKASSRIHTLSNQLNIAYRGSASGYGAYHRIAFELRQARIALANWENMLTLPDDMISEGFADSANSTQASPLHYMKRTPMQAEKDNKWARVDAKKRMVAEEPKHVNSWHFIFSIFNR